MLKSLDKIIVGIDLAGTPKNPTGWAIMKNRAISTCHLYENSEILQNLSECSPSIVAIDAPLSFPAKNIMRKADKEMHKRGYPVYPPSFQAMKKLTMRAIGITKQIKKRKVTVIEVHPASTRRALRMPSKDWKTIQRIFAYIGLEGDLKIRALTPHEIDATTAALTARLHLEGKTELVGDRKEGYIVIPLKSDWRRLRL